MNVKIIAFCLTVFLWLAAFLLPMWMAPNNGQVFTTQNYDLPDPVEVIK